MTTEPSPRPGWTQARERRLILKRILADRLEKLMAERGWTQSELARRASSFMTDEQILGKKARGKKPALGRDLIALYLKRDSPVLPRPAQLYPIAKALSVTPDYLLPPPALAAHTAAPENGLQVLPASRQGRQRVLLNIELTPGALAKVMAVISADGALDL